MRRLSHHAWLALVLIAASTLTEHLLVHSKWYELYMPGGYLHLQRVLQESLESPEPGEYTPVRLVDASSLTYLSADNPGVRVNETEFVELLKDLARTKPKAIVVDIDLTRLPQEQDYSSAERSFFDRLNGLAVSNPHTVFAYAVSHGTFRKPDPFDGTLPRCAAGSTELPTSLDENGYHTRYYTKLWKDTRWGGRLGVPLLSESLAVKMGRGVLPHPFLPLLELEIPGEETPGVTTSAINYGLAPRLLTERVPLEEVKAVSFSDQVVILGNVDSPSKSDRVSIPGMEERIGCVMLGSIVYTRLYDRVQTVNESLSWVLVFLVGLMAWGVRCLITLVLRFVLTHLRLIWFIREPHRLELISSLIAIAMAFDVFAVWLPVARVLFPGFLATVTFLLLETIAHQLFYEPSERISHEARPAGRRTRHAVGGRRRRRRR